MAARIMGRARTALRIRHAEARGQLELWYQPKVVVPTGEIASAEALVRWRHPKRGLVLPGEFIENLESSFWIKQFNLAVFQRVARQAREWGLEGDGFVLCVNISPQCFSDPGLADDLLAIIEQHEVPAQLIRIEVTERGLAEAEDIAAGNAQRLADAGVQVLLDDFGIGYSSLRRLVEVPLHGIKIDRAFVGRMDTNERAAAVVVSATELAHTLGLSVIAEGVETEDVWFRLVPLGIDFAQGYLMASAMPPDEFIAWTRRRAGVFDAERRSLRDRRSVVARSGLVLALERRTGADRRRPALSAAG